jgi:hypothetical protein
MGSPSFIDLHKQIGDLRPFDLLWTTFGYGKPYQVFTGFFELTGGILILFRRTRIAGLLLIVSVMLNIILLNYTYQIGVLITAFYVLLVALFLLAPYARRIYMFFFTLQWTTLSDIYYIPGKNVRTRSFRIIATFFICYSFIANTRFAYNAYERRETTNNSRRYSLAKNYVVNNDTLRLIENDTARWRIWSERIADGRRFVTIATMKPDVSKTYIVEQDSLNHHLILHPFNQHDTIPLIFSYADINDNNWYMEGDIKQKHLRVEWERINPDTVLTLLKIKRTIITFDDDSNSE